MSVLPHDNIMNELYALADCDNDDHRLRKFMDMVDEVDEGAIPPLPDELTHMVNHLLAALLEYGLIDDEELQAYQEALSEEDTTPSEPDEDTEDDDSSDDGDDD